MMFGTLTQYVGAHADAQPDKVFWRAVSGSVTTETTFRQFQVRAVSFAHACRRAGLEPGQPVLIFLPHGVEAVSVFFGAMLAGGVPSFMPCPSPKQHASVYWPAHASLLQRTGRHVLVSDRHHAAQMQMHGLAAAGGVMVVEDIGDDASPLPALALDPEQPALLQHSSGTTSLKKGVVLTHRAILRQVALYSERLGASEADGIVSWLPLYHDMGLIACTVMPLVLGQTVTSLDPFEWVARPASMLEAIDRHDGRFAWMPNFAFEHLVRTVPDGFRVDLSRLRAFIDCSEPCRADTFDRFLQRFAPLGLRREQLQVCYAMAETVFAVSQTASGETARVVRLDAERLHRNRLAVDAAAPEPGAALRVLSAGRPLPGVEVRIREAGRDLADDQVGEVVLCGSILFDGYLNDPQTTLDRLSDGLYHTRDLGFLRDGELYVLGRKDDLLIVNGRNLHAHEVEAVVAGVAGVKPGRTVAFGVFNAQTGSEELVLVAERDAASGSAEDPVDDQRIARAVREAVHDATNIEVKTCRVVDPGWLVKTTSGKISREANRAKFLQDMAAAPRDADRLARLDSPTLARLADLIAARFKSPREAIGRDTVADDVEGWDSLAHATLILGIEESFGVRFADAEIFGFARVGDLADRIDELLAETGASAHPPAADRVVYQSPSASIVRLGEADGPDIIVFAGKGRNFGGLAAMDFASLFAQTSAADWTKYFVTDHCQDWFITCFDEVAAKLNALSDRPKIIVGNSMGGYAALRFAAALRGVIGVLAFVPQTIPLPRHTRTRGKPRASWRVGLVPEVPYCIVYGQAEDERDKDFLRQAITDPSRQRLIVVPNCGHNLVIYLNDKKLLGRVMESCLDPATMADGIQAAVSEIRPSQIALRQRARQLARKKTRRSGMVSAKAAAEAGDGAPAAPRAQPPVASETLADETLTQRFARATVGSDGRLTLRQARRTMPFVVRHFRAIDADRKGYVTLDDIRAFRRLQSPARSQRA